MHINNPLELHWCFPGLELTVLICAALTLRHALRNVGLFLWLSVVCYGVTMELVSYSFFDNYAHGRFTVTFYGERLPLYITAIYPLLIYTAIAATSRLALNRTVEPFVVGFAVIVLDVPWDVANSPAGWWSWSATDPNLRARWLGVPLSNYYWHLAFDGSLAFLVRFARPFVSTVPRLLMTAPIVGLATIISGVLAFVPYHLLTSVGVPEGLVMMTLFVMCALALILRNRLFMRRAGRTQVDWLLLSVPLLFHTFLFFVLATHRSTFAALAVSSLAMVITAMFYWRCAWAQSGN